MGSFYLILGLVFSLIIAIIALANTEQVTVSYIFGRAEMPLILLILGSAFVGALVMGFFALFRGIRNAFAFREMRSRQEKLEKQVKALEEEKVFLEAELNKAVSVPEEDTEGESEEGRAGKPQADPAPAEETAAEEKVEEEPDEPER